MRVHLCAREAGRGWNAGVLWTMEAANEGRSGCAGAIAFLKTTEGRTRRRRNWTGIVAAEMAMILSNLEKLMESRWLAWRMVCASPPTSALYFHCT